MFINDEDEIERLALAYSPKIHRILELAEAQIRAGQGIPHQDFWRAVESEMPETG